MKTYNAVARRDGRYWLVEVEGVGVTQGRNLQDARDMAADLVEVVTGEVGEVTFTVDLPDAVRAGIVTARESMRSAEQQLQSAAEQIRELASTLRAAEGLTGKDVAFVLEVSEQRVSQLAPTRRNPATTRYGVKPAKKRSTKLSPST